MSRVPTLIAWDFDGVLNRNIRDGRFIWADRLEEDLGLCPRAFQSHVFGPDRDVRVMTGALDLVAVLKEWLAGLSSPVDADRFMRYWFENDVFPDPEVLGWLRRATGRSVLATNNESYRTRFIVEEMGLGREVEKVFASGHLGVAKPDRRFFDVIEDWSGHGGPDCLLIDDMEMNVDAARARGWQAFHFTDETRDALPGVLGLA